jgi:hypothetical protein
MDIPATWPAASCRSCLRVSPVVRLRRISKIHVPGAPAPPVMFVWDHDPYTSFARVSSRRFVGLVDHSSSKLQSGSLPLNRL